jgi:heat shock protein HslJ
MKTYFALVPALLAAGCMSTPPPPPLTPNPPGGVYHATGTEPFWGLAIDERQMVFTQPDAQPIAAPTPRVIVGFAGEMYQTPRLSVNIVHAQCSDGMSDRTYPDKVQVTADGRQFNGCGGL